MPPIRRERLRRTAAHGQIETRTRVHPQAPIPAHRESSVVGYVSMGALFGSQSLVRHDQKAPGQSYTDRIPPAGGKRGTAQRVESAIGVDGKSGNRVRAAVYGIERSCGCIRDYLLIAIEFGRTVTVESGSSGQVGGSRQRRQVPEPVIRVGEDGVLLRHTGSVAFDVEI